MPTHSKKVDVKLFLPYQAFTNDTSVTNAVTFADGDYIDFTACLGRPAKNVMIILNGVASVTLQFNTRMKASQRNLTEADTSITTSEDVVGTNPIRLFTDTAGESATFTFPSEFGIDIIKIIDWTGTASATANVTFIGF